MGKTWELLGSLPPGPPRQGLDLWTKPIRGFVASCSNVVSHRKFLHLSLCSQTAQFFFYALSLWFFFFTWRQTLSSSHAWVTNSHNICWGIRVGCRKKKTLQTLIFPIIIFSKVGLQWYRYGNTDDTDSRTTASCNQEKLLGTTFYQNKLYHIPQSQRTTEIRTNNGLYQVLPSLNDS